MSLGDVEIRVRDARSGRRVPVQPGGQGCEATRGGSDPQCGGTNLAQGDGLRSVHVPVGSTLLPVSFAILSHYSHSEAAHLSAPQF